MNARVIQGIVAIHVATLIGVIMADSRLARCHDSLNLLCGSVIEDLVNDRGNFQLSLNPVELGLTFQAIAGVFGNLLYYPSFTDSDNIVAALWVWVMRLTLWGIFMAMLYRAIPQVGNVLARFLGR